MKIETLLADAIEEQIDRFEKSGEPVKLKTLFKKRAIVTVILGIIFARFLLLDKLLFAFFTMLIYFIIIYRITNVSVITALAKKSPDENIGNIIRKDMRK